MNQELIISIFSIPFILIIIFQDQVRKFIESHRKALIVIDMQNDFLEDNCFFDKLNKNTEYGRKIIPNINKLSEIFREKNNMSVVFIHSLYGECSQPDLPPNFIQPIDLEQRSKGIPLNDVLRSGTHKQEEVTCCAKDDIFGRQIYKNIVIKAEQDTLIQKQYYSSFRKSTLHQFLQDNFIKNLVVTGVSTNYCVTATIIDAFHLGYNIILAEDAVAASQIKYHTTALENLKKYYCVAEQTDKIIQKIKNQ